MSSPSSPREMLDSTAFFRFSHGIKAFAASESGNAAKRYVVLLITLMLAISGLNVANSYVGRDFMTAIEHRDMHGFLLYAGLYILVFIASTMVAVYFKYVEESLGLLWRNWLTKSLLERYLKRRNYYRLYASGDIANPDQRITDDVKAFTTTTLSFSLMFLNGTFTAVAFSGVLWSISPLLFFAAVLYAGIGSYVSYYLGHSLVGLNYTQSDKEANFRAELIHIRENAESVALLHREERLKSGLLQRLEELTSNFQKIIKVNRRLGFYTTWYNYLAQIVPALIVAPLFILGTLEFGVVTQSAMAFTHLLGAFSLIVTNFQSISSFTAVIARLGSLEDAIDQGWNGAAAKNHAGEAHNELFPKSAIKLAEEKGHITYQDITLCSPHDGRLLIKDLSISIPYGTRLLISGRNEDAKMALFRATAGIWGNGSGLVSRPPFEHIYFLPERPYLPAVTLRELLVRTGHEQDISEQRILTDLTELGLEQVLTRVGDLDTPHEWSDMLSLNEQRLLAFARLFIASPRFAFLEWVGHALSIEDVDHVLKMLSARSITYLNVGRHGKRDHDDRLIDYDAMLLLEEGGNWSLTPISNGQLSNGSAHAPAVHSMDA